MPISENVRHINDLLVSERDQLSNVDKVSMLLTEILTFDYEIVDIDTSELGDVRIIFPTAIPCTTEQIVAIWYQACKLAGVAHNTRGVMPCWDCVDKSLAKECTHGATSPPRELLHSLLDTQTIP